MAVEISTPSVASSVRRDLQRALAEQQALATTIAQMIGTLAAQHAQLNVQLSPAMADRALPDQGLALSEECARVRVYCLGSFRFVVGREAIDHWRTGKARVLFQYLVNQRNKPVSRDTLINSLWPDPNALAAGTSLKVAVHALRQTFTSLGDANPLTVVAHDAGYLLRAGDLWLDVEEFERSFATGRRLDVQERGREALVYYARAAELYSGDFLEDCWDDWAVFRRESLKDQYLFVLARLADAAFAASDYQGCIVWCQRLLEQDRSREDTYRTLMLCHARLGQRERARRWFELCTRTLRAELDAEPEPVTIEVYKAAVGELNPSRPQHSAL